MPNIPSINLCSKCRNCEDLNEQLRHLTAVNQQQEKTINWMHDTIWELLSQNRKLKAKLEKVVSELHS